MIRLKRYNLPPLIALRALEASARLESFARAAEELEVTPGAISQHIKSIEAWAGTPLFKRTGKRLELNEDTRTALPLLSDAFDKLAEASQYLRARTRRNKVVSISAPPSFTSKWLIPRLAGFRATRPDIEVWVAADMNLIDFVTEDADIAIRYGQGRYDGLIAEELMKEAVVPVASPAFVAAYGPFRTPKDLVDAPLLHDRNTENDISCPDWAMWLRARGVSRPSARGARFNQSSLVIEEAIAGGGVALAKQAIAAADLNAGRLVKLFDDATPVAFAYWLVWPRGRTLSVPTRTFIAWLKAETLGDISDGAGI